MNGSRSSLIFPPCSELPRPIAVYPENVRRSLTDFMAQTQQFCSFYLEKLMFGVELKKVQEVIRYLEITEIPLAPRVVSGLMNLRGQIVTGVDLRRRLDLPDRPEGTHPMNVVIRSADGAVSLQVDEIGDVVEVTEESFERPPAPLAGKGRG